MQGNLNDLLKELPPELARTVARYGVRLAIDLLETFYADLLAGERAPEQPVARKKLGRPPKAAKEKMLPEVRLAKRQSGWSVDPEERKREMARRVEVSIAKKRAEKIGAAAKKRWETMTATQKQARLRSMQRGKKRAKHVKTDEEAAAA